MPYAHVGSQVAEQPRGEKQVVVLDHDGRALGRLGRDRLRESPVIPLVAGPRAPPRLVEDWRPRGLVEHVQQEPQGRVRDSVVGLPERQGIDRQHPDVELALERIGHFRHRRQPARQRAAGERPLPIVEGSADPDGVGRRRERGLHPH